MKNTLITFLLCLAINVSAQNNSTISATQELPNWSVLLANIPTSQVTSGILLDKIVDYSNLTNFNTTENNISSHKNFVYTLYACYRAINNIQCWYFDSS